MQRLARVAVAFTPSAPVDRYAMLAGRQSQLMDVINAVMQRGQHVALYGERGVGKTSLTNILSEVFDAEALPDYRAASINCGTEDTFESIWRNVFRELGMEVDPSDGDFTPEYVRFRLTRIEPAALIVLDELDRLDDDSALSLIADTIKTFSDHSIESTLVLVGVADSVDELVGEHGSIERALIQVQMPRMRIGELEGIIDKGCGFAGLQAEAAAVRRITMLSEGLPHYTHLLALHASQKAVADDRSEITLSDVDAAIDRAVETHTIRSDYQRAIRSTRGQTLYPQILLACALAQKDPLGGFPAGSIREPLAAITGHQYEIPAFAPHLTKFLEIERGSVLQRDGEPRRYFYRFTNPLLQPYVILTGVRNGVITDDILARFQATTDDEPNAPPRLF